MSKLESILNAEVIKKPQPSTVKWVGNAVYFKDNYVTHQTELSIGNIGYEKPDLLNPMILDEGLLYIICNIFGYSGKEVMYYRSNSSYIFIYIEVKARENSAYPFNRIDIALY